MGGENWGNWEMVPLKGEKGRAQTKAGRSCWLGMLQLNLAKRCTSMRRETIEFKFKLYSRRYFELENFRICSFFVLLFEDPSLRSLPLKPLPMSLSGLYCRRDASQRRSRPGLSWRCQLYEQMARDRWGFPLELWTISSFVLPTSKSPRSPSGPAERLCSSEDFVAADPVPP